MAENKYSLYSQRSATEQYVNWGKVASDITKGIVTVDGQRRAKKQAIDDATSEALAKLSEVADVNNGTASALLIRGSNQSKENLMIQTDLLKRGLITPQDYQLFMNQQKTGYANLSTAVQNWDKYFTEAQARLEPGEDGINSIASAAEIYNNESMLAFGNLNDKILWTNPANGQLQLVQMGKNKQTGLFTDMPDVKNNPGAYMNPNYMNSRMNFKENRKVLGQQADLVVENLAPFIQEEINNGVVTSYDDFRNYADFGTKENGEKQTYDEWLNEQVEGIVAIDSDAVQILTAQGYNLAQDKEEYEKKYCKEGVPCDFSKMITVSYVDGKPEYDMGAADEKLDVAKRLARNAIEVRIGQTIKKSGRPIQEPSSDKNVRKTKTDIIKEYNTILTSGNETEVRDVLDGQIRIQRGRETDPNKKIIGYDLSDDTITFTYADGTKSNPLLRREAILGDNPNTLDVVETDFNTGEYEGVNLSNQIFQLYNELGGDKANSFSSAQQVKSAVSDYGIKLGNVRDGDAFSGEYAKAPYDMSDAKDVTTSGNDFVSAMGGYEEPGGYTDDEDIDNIAINLDKIVENAFPTELLNEMDQEGLSITSDYMASMNDDGTGGKKDGEDDPSYITYKVIDKATGNVVFEYKASDIMEDKYTNTWKRVYDGFVQPYLKQRSQKRADTNVNSRSGNIGKLNNL